PCRLGGLCQGHLHHYGGGDAFHAGRRGGGRPRGLHACAGGVREALPNAGLLHDLRPVPLPRDRARLAHLSRPQGRAFRLFLRAVGDDPVRGEGASVRGGHGWDYVAAQYALAFIEPFGTLWFIYLLPIFFVVTKAVRRVPFTWLAAAALQIAA